MSHGNIQLQKLVQTKTCLDTLHIFSRTHAGPQKIANSKNKLQTKD